jgi:hypothetical protein
MSIWRYSNEPRLRAVLLIGAFAALAWTHFSFVRIASAQTVLALPPYGAALIAVDRLAI